MNSMPPNLAFDLLPKIDMLLIFAGPPGSGKTTLAEGLIVRQQLEGLDFSLPQPVMRTEIQSMKTRYYPGGTLIVEFSTLGINVAATTDEIERLIDVAQRTLVVTCQIDRFSLVRQYAVRMCKEKLRRTPEWLRYLRFGKLKQLAVYLLTGRIERGYRMWDEVIRALPRDNDIRFLKVTSRYGELGSYRISGDDD
jgi:KaiC/GvpD/RAD55 family RecA-like ATPase